MPIPLPDGRLADQQNHVNAAIRFTWIGWTRHPLFCYSSACTLDYRRNYGIMRTPSFFSDPLRRFLRSNRIATLPELKQALGTTVDTTVFRKLKELSYRSSYSHRGRYYT